MRRALVLGGGGVIGVAWELGVLEGLLGAGVPVAEVDVVVGTSAGAIAGARLRSSTVLERPATPNRSASGAAATRSPRPDPAALAEIFSLWGKIGLTTPEDARAIGALARVQNREGEAAWLERMAANVGNAWPTGDLRICAVSTETGERHVFDRNHGVELARAVAASSAVPGLFPSVEIAGALYMDGQVHSSTNADVLLDDAPVQVLIAMPTNEYTARGLGAHARRAAEAEIERLQAAGCTVSLRTPTEAEATDMGGSLMDLRGAPAARAIGLATGKAWAGEL